MSPIGEDVWITTTELRRHFHRVVREAKRGASFTIVLRGRPVARLVPVLSTDPTR